ncbi:MAG: hypothetical protein NW205_12745 [Hyphomicrobiaceae bacterium]|nr:hypothetical protein [Hyphomicrobiaceae bacterium]
MTEIKRIVVENFPVARLPEELRVGLAADARVTVTVEADAVVVQRRTLTDYFGAGKGAYPAPDDAVEQIRKLRDEWD